MKGDKEDRARTPANIEGSMMDLKIKGDTDEPRRLSREDGYPYRVEVTPSGASDDREVD